MDNLKYILLYTSDYIAMNNIQNETKKLLVTDFALNVSQLMLDISFCSRKECPCNSRMRIRSLLEHKDVLDYIYFLESYVGLEKFDWEEILK